MLQKTHIHMLNSNEFHGRMPLRAFNLRQPDDIMHGHSFHELVLVRRGSGTHITDFGEYPIRRGDVFLVIPGMAHAYRSVNNLEISNVIYMPEVLNLPLADLGGTEGFRLFFELPAVATGRRRTVVCNRMTFNETQLGDAERIISGMMIEQQYPKAGQEFFMKLRLMELWGLICRSFSELPDKSFDEFDRLSRVVKFIEGNYASQISLAELAGIGGRSPSVLIRTFKTAFDCTPIEYLINFRLQKGAAMLLENDRVRVIDVALKNGFCDSNYFAKLFLRKYGCSPREYRRNGGHAEEGAQS